MMEAFTFVLVRRLSRKIYVRSVSFVVFSNCCFIPVSEALVNRFKAYRKAKKAETSETPS